MISSALFGMIGKGGIVVKGSLSFRLPLCYNVLQCTLYSRNINEDKSLGRLQENFLPINLGCKLCLGLCLQFQSCGHPYVQKVC